MLSKESFGSDAFRGRNCHAHNLLHLQRAEVCVGQHLLTQNIPLVIAQFARVPSQHAVFSENKIAIDPTANIPLEYTPTAPLDTML